MGNLHFCTNIWIPIIKTSDKRSISCTLILLLSSQPTDSSPQDAGFIPFNRGINGQMMVELGLSLNVLSFHLNSVHFMGDQYQNPNMLLSAGSYI